jgi:DNA invertase Pin-like site-specific DNA recombinase
MKAIGYVRVSTEEQAKGGTSLNMQKAKIAAYASLEEMELVDIIGDEGISGSSIKGRAGVQRVLQMVRERKVDALVVFKLDRLARNTTECLSIATLCQKHGVSLRSITEKLDTESAIGKFFFTLLASLGEMERALIGERIKAVMDRKRELGQATTGNPQYGFKVVDGHVVPDPDEQETIQRILDLHAQRVSIYEIVEILRREGRVNRRGKVMAKTQIHSIIQRKAA